MINIGYLQAIAYVLITSLSTVWLSHLGNKLPISLLLFGTSIIPIFVFNIIAYKEFFRNHSYIFSRPFLSISIMTTSGLGWFLTYYAAIYASARLEIAIFFLTIAGLSAIQKKQLISILLIILAEILIYLFLPEATVITTLAAIFAGATCYLYLKVSTYYIRSNNLSVASVLAVRFYPLSLLCFLWLLYILHTKKLIIPSSMSYAYLLEVLIILGLLKNVVQIFLSQSSSKNIGVESFSFIATLLPVATYLLQEIFIGNWSMAEFIVCLFVSIVLLAIQLFRKEKKNVNNSLNRLK